MDHLLEALINKNVSENEEHLRVLISTLNGKSFELCLVCNIFINALLSGLAGLQLLLQNPKEAVEEYKKALQHVHKYTELKDPVYLSVDMLQTIHILHNLAEILTGFTDLGSQKEVEDYRNQCKELENKYIDKHNKMVNITVDTCIGFNKYSTKFADVQSAFRSDFPWTIYNRKRKQIRSSETWLVWCCHGVYC